MNKEKYVDESWKEQAFEEKNKIEDSTIEQKASAAVTEGSSSGEAPASEAGKVNEVEINFLNYVTSLGFQAMIFMGVIPNPVSNEVEKNLAQAKFLIDTLTMLKEKTAGNLTDQENNLLESSVYELQMRYVQLVQEGLSSGGDKAK